MSRISQIVEATNHFGGTPLLEHMKEYHTSAVSLATIENFELCDAQAFGTTRRKSVQKTDTQTLFQAGSISKPLFAAAVMRLVERDILDLDADICKYLPSFDLPTFDGNHYKITLRQLLSHNAGLNLHGFAGYLQNQKIPDVMQILTGTCPANNLRLKLTKSPETGFEYSGGGYMLAQEIASEVSTRNFCDLAQDLLFAPLHMSRSTYEQPLPRDLRDNFAAGCNFHDLQVLGGFNIMPELAAAGLWTTPTDLALFGIEIMKCLQGKSDFLKKGSAELMTQKVYENSPYGIGFNIGECKHGATFGHGGSNIGYHSYMIFCPADGSGLAVMQNSDIGEDICGELVNAFKEICSW